MEQPTNCWSSKLFDTLSSMRLYIFKMSISVGWGPYKMAQCTLRDSIKGNCFIFHLLVVHQIKQRVSQ